MNRRESLRYLAALGVVPLFANWKFIDEEIMKRTIPATGESLPVVGTGTWETFDVDETVTAEMKQLKEVLSILANKGGKVVDTSPMYGFAEKNVGNLSTELGINDKLFMATKVWTTGKERGIEQMNNSLSLMKRDKMDLMQIHNLVDWQTHIKTLRDWKEKGKIRYLGITHYREEAYADMEHIMKTEPIDFIQVNYNIADRKSADRILPLAREKNLAVITSQPFGTGKLFQRVKGKSLPSWASEFDCKSWAQFFLKFIISNPAVTCVIPGTGLPEHMLDNIQAGFGRLPDEKQREMMIKAV
ncbi:MAG TPA: aldo/keto reductase [Cyclobacteriaceae bacterium]|nr:aldo/keto reductase [Cyclobacteriaceae bacterium]